LRGDLLSGVPGTVCVVTDLGEGNGGEAVLVEAMCAPDTEVFASSGGDSSVSGGRGGVQAWGLATAVAAGAVAVAVATVCAVRRVRAGREAAARQRAAEAKAAQWQVFLDIASAAIADAQHRSRVHSPNGTHAGPVAPAPPCLDLEASPPLPPRPAMAPPAAVRVHVHV
jgi:hypothetical protein